MSTTVHASTQPELSTTLPSYEDDDVLHKRLDFISVAIICGVILICFFICIVIGCRRTKRRRPPRCQDISTPPMESSRSGTFCVISGPRATWLTHCRSISILVAVCDAWPGMPRSHSIHHQFHGYIGPKQICLQYCDTVDSSVLVQYRSKVQ